VNNKKGEKKKNKKKLRKEISRRKRCEKKENRKKGTGSKLKRPSLTRVCPPQTKNLLALSRRLPAINQNQTRTLPASHHPPDAVVDPTKLTITNISLSSLT
jgi:hypothetical protein